MKIAFAANKWEHKGEKVWTYADCMVSDLESREGIEVTEVGKDRLTPEEYAKFDLLIDVDSGRDTKGEYKWHLAEPVNIPSVLYLVDSHGHPDLHQSLSIHADHVFFAVWAKRELFNGHSSEYWTPNFTDKHWFNPGYKKLSPQFDVGFFGSKHGLDRTKPLEALCKIDGWSSDIRQVNKKGKPQWPHTAEAMGNCKVLFNHGQKHDDPNLRVIESMALNIPLITPNDPRSGIGYVFEPWQDFIPYEAYSYDGLQERLRFALDTHIEAAAEIATNAYNKVMDEHLTEHRINHILEVVNA